jgi:hypothetical protein
MDAVQASFDVPVWRSDNTFGLTNMVASELIDKRTGKNTKRLSGVAEQGYTFVYGQSQTSIENINCGRKNGQ